MKMLMLEDLKQLRSLLGGLSCYRKILCHRIRSITSLSNKASRSSLLLPWKP